MARLRSASFTSMLIDVNDHPLCPSVTTRPLRTDCYDLIGETGNRATARFPSRRYFTSGAVSKLWYGGGELRVHSSPCGSAVSHTLSLALTPPRAVDQMM